MAYTIWLEFEEYADEDPHGNDDGYCNVGVIFDNGTVEGYNVWTLDYFKGRVQELISEAEEQGYVRLPDLIVSRLEREHITEVLKGFVVDPSAPS